MTTEDHSSGASAPGARRPGGLWARDVTIVLTGWLFVSGFLWAHSATSRQNTLVVGLLMLVSAVGALLAPAARRVNTVLAVWLFASSVWLFEGSTFTAWHNSLVAVLVFVLSFVPSTTLRAPGSRSSAHRL